VTDKERQEVLKRIDQMPNVTASNKERLYYYVERAQRIQRVMNVSFPSGGTKLPEASIKKLVEESKQSDFVKQAHDPVTVFVVLGFADKKAEEKSNMQVSHDRAEHLAELLRTRCGVSNTQTVPMGSSDLFSAQAAAENRVAEVWAVTP
jgi:outer membrane protein OmpA-like peptidoglycan-associated protein